MLLALRGWGPSDLESVDPSFREAAHFGIYAERLAGIHRQADEVLDLDLSGYTGRQRANAAKAKVDAKEQRRLIRAELAMED